MKRVFEPITNTVKQTAQAIGLREEETIKSIIEIENLIKYTTNFDLPLLESLIQVANIKNTSQFRLRLDPFSKRVYPKNCSQCT